MATVTFRFGTDMRTFAGYDFPTQESSGGGGSEGATVWRWDWSSGFTDIVTGMNMATPTGFFPSAGTVTGWELDFNDIVFNPSDPFHAITHTYNLWTFDDLSLAASDFSNAIQSDGATLAAAMSNWLSGNDSIGGSTDDDYLLGYSGNDMLNGRAGADRMLGGAGNDIYVVDNIGDKVTENASAGTDLVKSSISYTLGDNIENLTLTGTGAIDGKGNDRANVINGNGAANTLRGAADNDVIHGGAGDDVLVGGSGNDTLDGDRGADEFLFNAALNASTNHDNIADFSVADDTIALSKSIFTSLTTLGTLTTANFFIGSSAHDGDDHIIYNPSTGKIYYDDDGNGPDAQILFAHVTADTALTNSDFHIVG